MWYLQYCFLHCIALYRAMVKNLTNSKTLELFCRDLIAPIVREICRIQALNCCSADSVPCYYTVCVHVLALGASCISRLILWNRM